jgi:predicted transcriptional regulator YdeE
MGQNANLKITGEEGYRPKRIPQALKIIQGRLFPQSEGKAVPANGSILTLREMKMVGVKCVGLMHFGELIPAATYQLMEQLDRIPNRVHPEMHFGIAPCSQSQDDDETHTYYVAIEVSDFQGVPEDLVCIEIPETIYAVVKKELGNHVGDLYRDSWEYLDAQQLQKMQTNEPTMTVQLEIFHESLENYWTRVIGHPEADFEMDLCVPIELIPDSYKPERVPAALRVLQQQTKSEVRTMVVEDMTPQIVEHSELKLIGIPCISLKDMSGKYHHAKEALLSSTKHLPSVKNPSIQYGIWPQVPTQQQSEMHAYILCVEVESFDGIPEWYFRTTLPPQKCVVVSNKNGDFDAANHAIDQYISDNGITVGANDRKYVICERYNYECEGFARYSLPILST